MFSSANAFNLCQSRILLCGKELNSSSDVRILDWSKLKVVTDADHKQNMPQMVELFLERGKTLCEKGANFYC